MNLISVFKDVLPLLRQYAPTIAHAIGGPSGLVINFIVPLLAKTFNSDVHNISDLVKNINTDQNSADKLKTIEQEHAQFIQDLLAQMNHIESAELNLKIQWRN